MTEKQIARYQHVSNFAGLAMLIFGAIAAFDWLGKVQPLDGVSLTQIFTGLGVICGVVARWAAGMLPPVKPKAPPLGLLVLLLAIGLMVAAGCKVPPLAMGYRGHAVLVTARDGAGEVLANTQRAKMIKCEADHMPKAPDFRVNIIACYKKVRAPLLAWVKHVRPAITATASAFWLALESAYVLKAKDLDKSSKAVQLACAALRALEATLGQYANQLGRLKAVLLGAVAGGKVFVCR